MISVIVANHNGAAHLERCLSSLRGQHQDLEVLLVDNASTDRSIEIVRSEFPEVRVLELDRNIGFGAANNRAAGEAHGQALLLLNADAWLEHGAATALEQKLLRDPRTALVAPTLTYPDGGRQFVWSPARGVLGEALQKLRNPFERSAIVHGSMARAVARLAGRLWYTAACVLVRSHAYRHIGGFDERYFMYFEDVDLCLRLEAAGWRLAREPRALVRHRGGLAGRGEVGAVYRRSQLQFYDAHRPRWERAVIAQRLARRYGSEEVERWRRGEAAL
jgi:hypothetical protein